MKELELVVEARESAGKGAVRKLRTTGMIPGILYGLDKTSQMLGIPRRELVRMLKSAHGENIVLDLAVTGSKTEKVLLKDIQRHPVTDDVLHVDFLRIDLTKKIQVSVPVKLTGTPEGVKIGGMLEFTRRELDISCLPIDIPDYIEVDVSHLVINEAIHVSDISIDKVEILTNPVRTIVTVQPPIVSKEPVAARVKRVRKRFRPKKKPPNLKSLPKRRRKRRRGERNKEYHSSASLPFTLQPVIVRSVNSPSGRRLLHILLLVVLGS